MIRALLALLILLWAAAAGAQPQPLDQAYRLGPGEVRLAAMEWREEVLGETADEGGRFLVIAGSYRRDGEAAPLRIEAGQDVFRLVLSGGPLGPDPLTQDLLDAWWNAVDVLPGEERLFELVFRVPSVEEPRGLEVALAGERLLLPLVAAVSEADEQGAVAAGESEAGEAPEAGAAEPAGGAGDTLQAEAGEVETAQPEAGAAPVSGGAGQAEAAATAPATAPSERMAAVLPDALPAALPVPAPLRNVLTARPLVVSIGASDGHEALIDGRRGADAPVTRADPGVAIELELRWPVMAEGLRLSLRPPATGSYRVRVEASADGKIFVPLPGGAELALSDEAGLSFASREVRALRIVPLALPAGSEGLIVEEVELLSRESVPVLEANLAWAGHGGQALDQQPGPADEGALFRLVDGDPSPGWSIPDGASQATVTFGFLDNRSFLVDAIMLQGGAGMAELTAVEVAGDSPAGPFAPVPVLRGVSLDEDYLVILPPTPARYLRLTFQATQEARSLGEVRIYEASAPGYRSRFAEFVAQPAEAPRAGFNLALAANGGKLLAVPALENGTPEQLLDGETSWQSLYPQENPATFRMAFSGLRAARLGEVRFNIESLDWPTRARVRVADSPEGPFRMVREVLVPPSGDDWRAIAFDPVVARVVELSLDLPPEDGDGVSIDEIAVMEAPDADNPSIFEVPFAEQLPIGANLALSLLGGQVVSADQEEQLQGWSARRLIDGLVGDAYSAARGSFGFTSREGVSFPLDITLELGGRTAARIAGVGIDPSFRFKESGILDSSFRGDPANRPRRFEVYLSADGRTWQKALEGEMRNRTVRQTFAFDEARSARFVRFRFLDNFGGGRLQLGELEVYEDPSLDSTRSVLGGQPLNILRPELGGAVVEFTSQYFSGKAFVGNIADGTTESIWSPDGGWRYPQKIRMAFAGTAEALIEAIELEPNEADKRPRTIKIRSSRSNSPNAGWKLVGTFRAPAASALWRITFDKPLRARYLEISITESFHQNYVQIGELRVFEARRPGYRSVLARATEETLQRQRAFTSSVAGLEMFEADIFETEPNDRPEDAQIVQLNQSVAGRIEPLGERDHFLFSLDPQAEPPGGPLLLALEGRPGLQVRFELEDKGGETLFSLDPDPGRERLETSLSLGSAALARITQPRTRIVLVVDRSGSMEERIADAREAVRRFISSIGEQEEVAILAFSSDSELVHDFSRDRRSLDAAAAGAIYAGGGTALYDAMMQAVGRLEDYPGNRAIILLSDGADSQSSEAGAFDVLRALSRKNIRLYAIALGEGMWRYDDGLGTMPARMLEFWTRASGGQMLPTPSAAELSRLYDAIGRELRTGTRYRLRLSRPEGAGRLVLRQTGERIAGVGTPDRILFILDASGSMRGKDKAGAVKMQTAREVMKNLVRSLPDDVQIGLRLYGHRAPSKPKARSCTDTQLVVPFQRVDRERFAAFLDQIKPRGQTPIGLSLRQVADDFGAQPGRKIVVLITDGEETCSPDPGDPDYPPRVVANLQAAGVDLRVNIVGFDIDKQEVRDFLRDLAGRTGGLFASAEDAASLGAALEQALRAPYRVEDAAGNEIARGTLDGGAIELPVGVYRVVIEATEPLVVEEVRIERERETRIDINREGEEIAIDRATGAVETALAADRPVAAARAEAATAEQVAQLLAEAEKLMAEDKLTTPEGGSALSRYRAVLALDPENSEAQAGILRIVTTYLDWAAAAEERGDLARAAEYYGRALAADPENATLFLLRGITYLMLEDNPRAAQDFERAAEIAPDEPEAHFYLGMAWMQADDPARAVAPLRKARDFPEYKYRNNAGYMLAAALASSGQLEEAYDVLTQTITEKGDCEEAPLDELCTDLWTIMVRILDAMDKDETVMETLPPLLEMEPASPGLHDAIADVFRGNGREDEAAGIEAERKRLFGR